MTDIALAFLWHQHQPYYPDDVAGENPMPWVRLHGVKDYYGMAQHLLEFPEMRCTINLVPSLLVQLQRYTDRGGSDQFLDVSRRPADGQGESRRPPFFVSRPHRLPVAGGGTRLGDPTVTTMTDPTEAGPAPERRGCARHPCPAPATVLYVLPPSYRPDCGRLHDLSESGIGLASRASAI